MKKSRVILCAVLILFAFSACGGDHPTAPEETAGSEIAAYSEPPQLNILCAGEAYPALRGTYSWSVENGDGEFFCVTADGAHPLESLAYLEVIPKCGETGFALCFESEPDEVQVRCWEDKYAGNAASYEADFTILHPEGDNYFLPDGDGFIIEAYAVWSGERCSGNAHYSFYIA